MKLKEIKSEPAGLIILLILATIFVVPVRAEEEYHVIATLKPTIPGGFGGYGGDIALSEDFLLIGEWWGYNQEVGLAGLAYLYDADWNLLSTLQAPEPQPNGEFGRAVDIFDDMMIIGSPLHKAEGLRFAGEVYVFDSDGSLQFTLQSPDPRKQGKFGIEVAIGKDVILIGESGGLKQGFLHAGAVHVYSTEGVYITTLTSPSMKHNGLFGMKITANEDYILVGEPGSTDVAPFVIGSVHVFDYDWNLVKTIQTPEQEAQTIFGKSMAIKDDTVVIGEMWADVEGIERAGKAYRYDTEWNHLATFQSTAPRAGGEFGRGIAIGGDLIVMGERRADVIIEKEGKAYVYDMEGNLVSTLTSPDPTVGAQFGFKVATDGEIVVVADVEGTVDGQTKAGKVHVFGLGEPAAEQPTPDEETTEAESESETESETSGGIPGFPIESIVLSVVLAVLVLWLIQRQR